MQYDPELYPPDPQEFRPERFLDGAPEPYTWVPFGGGVRRCLGAAFAQLEMKVVIATILRARAAASAAREAQRERALPRRHAAAEPRRRGGRRERVLAGCRALRFLQATTGKESVPQQQQSLIRRRLELRDGVRRVRAAGAVGCEPARVLPRLEPDELRVVVVGEQAGATLPGGSPASDVTSIVPSEATRPSNGTTSGNPSAPTQPSRR